MTATLVITLSSCGAEPAKPAPKTPDSSGKGAAADQKNTPAKADAAKDKAGKAGEPVDAATPGAKKYVYTAAERSTAKANWMVCATCHGNKGKGDGVAGMHLNPKPRDYTDKKWQAETDDARLFKVIKEGGKSVGLSDQMQGYPHLSDGTIWALVEMIRNFGK
jgi:cytochrome c553